jgi:hypothetical protein
MPRSRFQHIYRLVIADDGSGTGQTIEFEAPYRESALAQQQCRGCEAELFEDDRSLGRVQCMAQGGFWLLSRSREAGTQG